MSAFGAKADIRNTDIIKVRLRKIIPPKPAL